MPSPLVLVVDDAADSREPLVSLLQRRGYRTIEAAHGAEALDVLHEHRDTALVLLDLLMPTVDGWTFRERQLGDPTIAHVPVVILSIAKQTEMVRYPLRARAVLHKSASSVDDILAAVEDCCGPARPASEVSAGEKTKWAAAFLRGRAKAFTRGNVPYAALATAVRIAEREGVPEGVISATLRMHNLQRDWSTNAIRTLGGDDERDG